MFGANVKYGFCLWDLLALAILIAVVVAYIYEEKRHKRRMDEIEDKADANVRQS